VPQPTHAADVGAIRRCYSAVPEWRYFWFLELLGLTIGLVGLTLIFVGADNESVGAFRGSPLYLLRVRDVCATGWSSPIRSGSANAQSLFAAKLNGVARTIATA
jgi:hypothetical protein